MVIIFCPDKSAEKMERTSGRNSEGRTRETWTGVENSRRIWGKARDIFAEKRRGKKKTRRTTS